MCTFRPSAMLETMILISILKERIINSNESWGNSLEQSRNFLCELEDYEMTVMFSSKNILLVHEIFRAAICYQL